jgi:hypothetical protein
MQDEATGGGTRSRSWRRLWDVVQQSSSPSSCPDRPLLGEYAQIVNRLGPAAASERFPAVADHLASGCPRCRDDLSELSS